MIITTVLITIYSFFKKKEMTVFHPESPGVKITVYRNGIQRLLLPRDFATLKETIGYYENQSNRSIPTR